MSEKYFMWLYNALAVAAFKASFGYTYACRREVIVRGSLNNPKFKIRVQEGDKSLISWSYLTS